MTAPTSPPAPGHETPPLTPMSLTALVARIEHEWATRQRIFDLPTARFWAPDPNLDLGFDFLGRRCATPIGPAAGPHSQLAENIVLAWLGGSRLFELKTVQVLDDLVINRPCIDMETIGYNIEWSQELTVPQSLTEYVKASMLVEMLARWDALAPHVGTDPGPYVFDMSVGYDLAGISGDKVRTFIEGMADATAEVAALRAELAALPSTSAFAAFADHRFETRIADTLTLSTFHGCPPDEIEAITKHLIDAHDLDVIVKLNPTLLGYETVARIVNNDLGYTDVAVKEEAFAEDLQFDRGLELIDELHAYAAERGRRFGIKLTNTLVVHNTKGWMPDETMYLSGPPLHVLAMTLCDRLATALPGRFDLPSSGEAGDIMVSFSAGIAKENLADALATGVNPATVCSDLLKPGGYGRLAPMLKALASEVRADGATSLDQWRTARLVAANQAGFTSTVAHHVHGLLGEHLSLYHVAGNSKPPRQVDNDLAMFGCVACNFCVTVCPNDAFFAAPSPDGVEGRHQYLVLAELCNECGNCMTFCPERGDPAEIKPRLFTDPALFAARTGQGFLLAEAGGSVTVSPRRDADVEAAAVVGRILGADGGSPLPVGSADIGGQA